MKSKERILDVLSNLWEKKNDMYELRRATSTLLCLRYLSMEYEVIARKRIGPEYDDCARNGISPLAVWYKRHSEDGLREEFEDWMRKNGNRCVIRPQMSWNRLADEMSFMSSSDMTKFLKTMVGEIGESSQDRSLGWLSAAVAWDRVKPLSLKRLVAAIDWECPNRSSIRSAFERTLQWFSRFLDKHPFHVPAPLADLMADLALRLPAKYDDRAPFVVENLLSFNAGDGTPLAGVLGRLDHVKSIYMQEQDPREELIARLNLLVHGAGGMDLVTSRTHPLRDDWRVFNPNETVNKTLCDAIVAFPAFGESWQGVLQDRLDGRFRKYCTEGVPGPAEPELAFLLHGLHFLKPEGTMVLGGAETMLNRAYDVEREIRRKLVEYGNLEAIVALPDAMFERITGMPTALMVAGTERAPHGVMFVDARNVTSEALGRPLFDAVLDACHFHVETPGFSRIVSPDELRQNDYDLSPRRYIEPFMERMQNMEPVESCEEPSI